jgi:hypothetical protein
MISGEWYFQGIPWASFSLKLHDELQGRQLATYLCINYPKVIPCFRPDTEGYRNST